jgi:hypothetical protein
MRTILLTVFAIVLSNATHLAQEKSPSDLAFERLKRLAGTWEALDKRASRKLNAVYAVTGGGNVIMEDLEGMATAYHLDNGTIKLTHYCGAGNQPRMRVKSIENGGRRIVFEMFDITNLKSPDAYRSTSLDVQFLDDGTVELTYGGWSTANGSSSQTIQLQRRTSTSTRR